MNDMPSDEMKLTSGRLLANNVLWNLFGRIAPLITAVVSIPLLISNLGIERFGILTLVWMIIGYFSFFDLGLGRALTKLISERIGKNQKTDLPSLIWTGLLLMLILGMIGGVISAILSSWLVNSALKIPLLLRIEAQTVFYLLSFSIPIVITGTGLRGILEAYQRFALVNSINIPMGMFSFLAPLLVLPFSKSLVPIVVILVFGRLAGWGIYLYYCYSIIPEMRLGVLLEKKMLSLLIRFGGWLTVTNVIGPFMVYLDRFMIGAFVSMASLAYYTTPYEVVTKLWIIPGAMVGVLFPAFAMSFTQDRNRMTALFVKSVKYIFVIFFPITLIIVSLAHNILNLWLGAEFANNSTPILQWLAVGVFINSIGQIPYTMIQSTGRPDFTAKLHLVELPIYLLMLWFMLSKFGIIGAAIAWTVRVSIDTMLLFRLAQLFLSPDIFIHHVKKVAFGAFISFSLIYISTLMNEMLLVKVLFLMFVLILSAVISWFMILSPDERKFAQTWGSLIRS